MEAVAKVAAMPWCRTLFEPTPLSVFCDQYAQYARTRARSERAARSLKEAARGLLNDWCREQRAAGLPLELIEGLAKLTERVSAAQIECDLPQIMRNMAITAGAVALH